MPANSFALPKTEYHSYYQPYITILGEIELQEALHESLGHIEKLFDRLEAKQLAFAYDTDKWSVAEVIQHLIDTELIFQYRALRIARNEKLGLLGFDQDAYVHASKANTKSKKQFYELFLSARKTTIALYESFDEDDLLCCGQAGGGPVSVRALGFLICGHQKHHFQILQQRYF